MRVPRAVWYRLFSAILTAVARAILRLPRPNKGEGEDDPDPPPEPLPDNRRR